MPPPSDLPPFGIRDLLGAGQSPGLIQITQDQYDTTLKSQPDSSLTYVDEDDGDLITVGSGLELSERLQDPVPPALRYSLTSAVNPWNGELVHVFDIKHSAGNLAVWREHEAYSSKKLRQPIAETTIPVSANSAEQRAGVAGGSSVDCDDKVQPSSTKQHTGILGRKAALKYYDVDPDTTISRLYEIFALSGKVVRIRPYLNDQGQSQGSGFVLFASEVDANKALKELNGFTVGTRSLKLCKLSSKPSSEGQISDIPSDIQPEKLPESENVQEETERQEQDLTPVPVTADVIISGIEKHLGGLADVLQLAANTLQKAAQKASETETSVVEDVLKGVRDILTEVGTFGSEVFKAFETEVNKASDIPESQPAQSDVQDSQAAVSETHEDVVLNSMTTDSPDPEPTYDPTAPDVVDKESTRIQPEFTKDPHALAEVWSPVSPIPVPIPGSRSDQYVTQPKQVSILDDETEDAAFTARYPPLMSVRRAQTVNGTAQRGRYRPYKRRSVPVESPVSPLRDRPSVKFDTEGIKHSETDTQISNDDKLDAAESFYRNLPGAWPEPKIEQYGANLPASNESSGAFFDRMVGRDRSCDNTFPFSQGRGPRRFNTTASSNPASRLNKPFDPGFAHASRGWREPVDKITTDFNHEGSPSSFTPFSFGKPPRKPHWQASRLRHEHIESSGSQRPAARFSQTTDQIAPTFPRPSPGSTRTAPRHFRSVPNFRPDLEEVTSRLDSFTFNPSPPASTFETHPSRAQPVDKVDVCVEQLKTLGFGINDEVLANRLHVYAVAADGDVSQAIEMIEEDKQAVIGFRCFW